MVFTVVMFFVLIVPYVAMFGLVKFCENVIGKPLGKAAGTRTTESAKSL